jgi:single-strand DNA-binding protein
MIDLFSKSINLLIAKGKIGRIGELYNPNTKPYIKFSIACNSHNHTEWYNCIAYGRYAEWLSQYAQKATEVTILGTPKTEKWDDKNGKKRSKQTIHVEKLGFGDDTKPTISRPTKEDDYLKNIEISEEDNEKALKMAKFLVEQEGYKLTKVDKEETENE